MLSWLITMMVPGRAGENNEQSRDLRQGGDARGLRQPPASPLRQPVQTGNASAADDGQGLLNQSFSSADQQNSQYQSPMGAGNGGGSRFTLTEQHTAMNSTAQMQAPTACPLLRTGGSLSAPLRKAGGS